MRRNNNTLVPSADRRIDSSGCDADVCVTPPLHRLCFFFSFLFNYVQEYTRRVCVCIFQFHFRIPARAAAPTKRTLTTSVTVVSVYGYHDVCSWQSNEIADDDAAAAIVRRRCYSSPALLTRERVKTNKSIDRLPPCNNRCDRVLLDAVLLTLPLLLFTLFVPRFSFSLLRCFFLFFSSSAISSRGKCTRARKHLTPAATDR